MSERELAERVFRARNEHYRKTGHDLDPTAMVLHPLDWNDVKIDGLRVGHGALGAQTFMGIPVSLDADRDRGRVSLVWIVEA